MIKVDEMGEIAQLINSCQKCDLSKTRTQVVVGEGSDDADIMFIGEAPGFNEDQQGRPFVGKAGKILDELLESIGFKRNEVFIANILKCRPPNNRNPLQSEIAECTGYLDRQIECIHPKMIVALGNFAASYIFSKFGLSYDKIGKIHGKIFQITTIFGPLQIIPIYHPAAATYNPKMKEVLQQDFYKIIEALKGQPIPH
jgi:DNA polymerase